ncbi:tRNA lysidine(34) synthetase [Flaviaesturariibacter terrae]
MDLLSGFRNYIGQQHWDLVNKRCIVAVSGGLDSVVLAHLCREAGFDFAIAHCNFQLRGAESDGDAAFVRELATTLHVPYFEKRFDTNAYAETNKVSIQVAARELRYRWFDELLHQEGPHDSRFTIHDSRILTAHHRDDSIETLLHHFFRGTGIAGLQGIPPQNGRVVRPLLFAGRDEIRAWAEAHSIRWREDSSNASTKYTRNALRQQLLPLLETIYPQLRQNLTGNIERFREAEQLYRAAIDAQLHKLVEVKDGITRVPLRKLLAATPLQTVLYELARPFGFTTGQTEGLRRLLESEPGRFIDSATHRALRYGAWLLFAPLQGGADTVYILSKGEEGLLLDDHLLSVDTLPAPPAVIPNDPAVALLDARHIQYPLVVRRWKAGDYFYPLGMRKKKKLARFFIDSKVPRMLRDRLWVVESHKKIIWIAGFRIDDRFKVTGATRTILQLRLAPTAASGSPSPPTQNS